MTIVHLTPPLALDDETRRSAQHAVLSGRSWWALRLSSLDDWVHEWDVDPSSPNGHADWPRQPRRGRQAVRLYCPNGKLVQLGDTHDASGKLFEFKIGQRNFALGPGGTFQSQQVLGQVIGMIHGLNGECTLYAWEPLPAPEIPTDAPKAPIEQEWIAKSAEPGLYEAAVSNWHRLIAEYERTPQYKAWAQRFQAWERNSKGRLVGPIEDNVYALRYQGIGQLKADHLGIDDGEGR